MQLQCCGILFSGTPPTHTQGQGRVNYASVTTAFWKMSAEHQSHFWKWKAILLSTCCHHHYILTWNWCYLHWPRESGLHMGPRLWRCLGLSSLHFTSHLPALSSGRLLLVPDWCTPSCTKPGQRCTIFTWTGQDEQLSRWHSGLSWAVLVTSFPRSYLLCTE